MSRIAAIASAAQPMGVGEKVIPIDVAAPAAPSIAAVAVEVNWRLARMPAAAKPLPAF
jgi:hypothetical protein